MMNKNKFPVTKDFLSLLTRLTQQLIWVLFIFCILILLFYVMGNYQGFLDKNQLIILTVITISSVVMSFLSAIGIIENLVLLFISDKKPVKILSIIFLLITLIIGVLLSIFSTVLQDLSKGI